MKKLLSILSFLILSFASFGQIVQNLGAPNTDIRIRGFTSIDTGGVQYRTSYADTTALNTSLYLKSRPGMTARTGNTLWIRNSTATQWIEFGAGSLVTDTTTTILPSGTGSVADPFKNDLIVSQQAGNILQVFPDGVYATPQAQLLQNGLESGGLIIFEQNLDYTVTAAEYNINHIHYSSDETGITLDAADPTFDRIDLVVVNTSGNVDVITGTPSDDPQNPSYDPTTQLPLSFILVTANATAPAFCRDSIYFPNNGQTWTGSVSNAGRINLTSTNNPYSVTQDIEFTLAQNTDQLRLTKSTTISWGTYSVVAFKIRSKAAWPVNSRVTIQVYSGLTPQGISATLGDGIFGFNSSITNAYQTIVIPLGNLGVVVNADNILFTISTTSNNTIGFYLDNIELLGCEGVPVPTSGAFWNVGGNLQGTTLVGGTLDNFPVQLVTNNANALNISTSGNLTLQKTNPGISFQLGLFGASDYYIQRNATSLIYNTAGEHLFKVANNTMLSMNAATGHLFNKSDGTFQATLNPSGNFIIGTNTPQASALITMNSTTQGLLPPRMTTAQKNAISSPATGLVVYDTDLTGLYLYYTGAWHPIGNVYTASGGLSMSANNSVLGGSPLASNSTISTSSFSLTINSSNSTNTLEINNTNAGGYGVISTVVNSGAFYGTNSGSNGEAVITGLAAGNNTALQGVSNTGFGLTATSSGYVAILAASSSSSDPTVSIQKTPPTNDTIEELLRLTRSSGGAALSGIGISITFLPQTSTSAEVSNAIQSSWSNVNFPNRTSNFEITGVNNAITGTILTISGNGAQTWGAAYQGLGAGYLAVSNTGQVTWSAGGGGGGGDALTANPLSQFAATTSAQLAGVITNETGTNFLVYSDNPVLVTPNLGTPSALVGTNATGFPISTAISGLGTNVATALAVNVGGAGAFVTFNGALGTPSSGTVSTGVTLGDVTMNVTGTDAAGDLYYRSAGGILTRLAIGTNGQLLRTSASLLPEWFTSGGGTGTVTSITLTQPASGFTVTNSGVAATTVGTFTFALNNDLLAVENLATTGIVRRTGTNTWTAGTLVNLQTEITSTLTPPNGGTGFAGAFSAGQIMWASGASTLSRGFLNGTANQINVTSNAAGVTVSMAFNPTVQTLTDGATITWNVTNGGNGAVTINSTGRTLSITNPIAGYTYTVRIIQGAGGSKTITTWPTGTRWTGGVTPTLSTTAGQMDVVGLYYDGSNYYGTFLPNMN